MSKAVRLIVVLSGLALASATHAQYADWSEPLSPTLVPVEEVNEHWLGAADEQLNDDVMNATLALMQRWVRRRMSSRNAAPTSADSPGFAGTRLSVNRQRLRLTFRYRF